MILNKYKLQLVKETGKSYPEYTRQMTEPQKIANLLYDLDIDKEPVEAMILILVDVRLQIIGFTKLATGTTTMAIFDAKAIMQAALLSNATGIILAHNHPSGDPTPSPTDVTSTHKVQQAAELFNIAVLDHIIIGHDNRFCSLREKGYIK